MIKNLFKKLWKLIKSFGSVRGIISLLISFLIWYGWLLVFIIIGIIFNVTWMYSVGISGVLLWAGPFTPFFPIFLGTATFFRTVVFKDKTNQKGTDKDDRFRKEKITEESNELSETGETRSCESINRENT